MVIRENADRKANREIRLVHFTHLRVLALKRFSEQGESGEPGEPGAPGEVGPQVIRLVKYFVRLSTYNIGCCRNCWSIRIRRHTGKCCRIRDFKKNYVVCETALCLGNKWRRWSTGITWCTGIDCTFMRNKSLSAL